MRQTAQTTQWDGAQRRRVEAVVETLATLRSEGEDLALVAHDARNMVTALGLYCDLLEEPGVLTEPYRHYGNELRLVAAASRRLVEKLVALEAQGAELDPNQDRNLDRNQVQHPSSATPAHGAAIDLGKKPVQAVLNPPLRPASRWDLMPPVPIDNLAAELMANRNLLAALAGPAIQLTVDSEGGARAVKLNGEDLTRVLVNVVKNAAEAMPAGGKIRLSLRDLRQPIAARATPATPGPISSTPPAILAEESVSLTVEDSGPGIPEHSLAKIFEPGFSTQSSSYSENGWPATHRGLGLPITRSIIEAAGGSVHAGNQETSGARLTIVLPVRSD